MRNIRRLNPKNDFIFQKLFGEEESKGSLIGLLNAILGLKNDQQISNLQVKANRELTKNTIDDKTGRLDIYAESDDHVLFDIEMQLTNHRNMERRSLFYLSKVFIESLKKGEDYSKLKRTITINILDFILFDNNEPFHTTFHLYEDQNKSLLLTDAFEVHFIELPKFERVVKELDHPLHRYLMFLNEHLPDEQRQEIINLDPELKKTDELLLKLSADEDTFRLYEAREYALIERNSMIAGGIQKGKEIGLEIGKELGIEIGIDKGIELRNRELAKRFSTDGYDIEQIAKLLFMTKDDVIQLMKQSN